MAQKMSLRMRSSGCPDFEIEVDAESTVADVKIAAVSGCDIDPQTMRIVYAGRVLRDGEALLGYGLRSGDALHIARGRAPEPPAEPGFAVRLRGPGIDAALAVGGDTAVAEVRAIAAARCGFGPDDAHLLHRGRLLKDGGSLAECGVAQGDTVHVAKRQAVGSQLPSAGPAGERADETVSNAPMPMAWGGAEPANLRLAAQAMGLNLEEVQAFAAVVTAGPRAQRPAGENATELQARFAREARDMARAVRAYLGESEEDAELLADVSRVLAEARSRGAPVPNAAAFVDRTVARRRDGRARQARLDREAAGLQPELEDALAVAEATAAASARMPRRLGHGDSEAAGAQGEARPPGGQ